MYIKFLPSEYVLRYRKGKLIAEGAGLSFFYLEKFTTACSIPVSNTDTDFIFQEPTADFQSVSVQGQLTYRVFDYKKVASAMDFTVNLKNKKYNNDPLLKLSKRIVNLAEVIIKSRIGAMELTEALSSGQELSEKVIEGLGQTTELTELGVAVTGFSILKVSANAETVRALEAKAREEILRQADDALYERRNAAIEQERRVKENELSTEVAVEERRKKIRETEISTRRMVLEREVELARFEAESKAERERIEAASETELERIRTESEAEREKIKLEAEIELERRRKELAEMRLENARKDADAEAYRIAAVMEAYGRLSQDVLVALATLNMDPERMIAQAFEKLAEGSGRIGTLNVTPELFESLRTGVK